MNSNLKRSTFIFLLSAFMFFKGTAFLLADAPIQYDWSDKLARGAGNIVTCFFEIPREINYTTQESNLAEGWTLGLVKGFGIGLIRLGSGVLDLFTFPFNFPNYDKSPMMEPEYPWESGRTKISKYVLNSLAQQ